MDQEREDDNDKKKNGVKGNRSVPHFTQPYSAPLSHSLPPVSIIVFLGKICTSNCLDETLYRRGLAKSTDWLSLRARFWQIFLAPTCVCFPTPGTSVPSYLLALASL